MKPQSASGPVTVRSCNLPLSDLAVLRSLGGQQGFGVIPQALWVDSRLTFVVLGVEVALHEGPHPRHCITRGPTAFSTATLVRKLLNVRSPEKLEFTEITALVPFSTATPVLVI